MAKRQRGAQTGFRLAWGEISGAFGDIGVLLPIAAALITVNGLSATGVFFGFGVAYLATGLFYGLPLPVQPLKAVAAIAVAQQLRASTVVAAGWWMGILLLVFAFTGLGTRIGQLFSRPVVRGIQLGVGALLLRSGISLATRSQMVGGAPEAALHLAGRSIPVSWLLTGGMILLLAWLMRRRKGWPSALILVLCGVLTVAVSGGLRSVLGEVRVGVSLPKPGLPSASDLASAFVFLVLPQIPLTLGNAVFATVDTAQQYFGYRAARVTPQNLLKTMGIFQLVAALFGGAPVCHGSGGLTAHYKFGARSGLAPALMGVLCLALALFVDGNVVPILMLIPYPVLGVLLGFVGFQHGMLVRDLRTWDELAIALTIAGVGFATQNLALGFGIGILLDQVRRGLLARRVRAGDGR